MVDVLGVGGEGARNACEPAGEQGDCGRVGGEMGMQMANLVGQSHIADSCRLKKGSGFDFAGLLGKLAIAKATAFDHQSLQGHLSWQVSDLRRQLAKQAVAHTVRLDHRGID